MDPQIECQQRDGISGYAFPSVATATRKQLRSQLTPTDTSPPHWPSRDPVDGMSLLPANGAFFLSVQERSSAENC
jgi:hypothetical protein